MRKALKSTMKGTIHRWCIWHITQKFSKKLGKLPNYAKIHDDLKNAIYDSLDCEEFETNWPEVLLKYGAFTCTVCIYYSSDTDIVTFHIQVPVMLTWLYDKFHMWVPVFMKHLFWVGMKTTQRVKSIHRFFNGYLSKHTLLFEFVERYCHALEVRCTSEKKADDNNERYDKMMVRIDSLCSKALGYIKTTEVVMQALQLVELQVE
ncbi:protein FAR1-RELATED SEQUENCE 5-like [Chenopodium quinoa]|uniref:protein FAR1-RELATED SEQUENCE 5-like n=1 Tax=Chenopodium quinoa TaxID=63459 RepID=UPI000B795271|nr:protein FAR1-RELATED SEQUENCE 5-like [Chenopodium quinoa]